MPKKKLIHFEENLTFPHLFQRPYLSGPEEFPMKGHWRERFFSNQHPITLELGCGKGEYTVNLAKAHPGRNFIGVDIKGARLWRGCKDVQEAGIANVAFIRTRIEWIENFFGPQEVDEIWITFPDPRPKPGQAHRRLTSPEFLGRYQKIIGAGGYIHLKTDNHGLYEYTLDLIRRLGGILHFASADIYQQGEPHPATAIQTFYEAKYTQAGIPIKYIQFSLREYEG